MAPFHQLWADNERQIPARTNPIKYVSSGDYYIEYGPGVLSAMPHNPESVRVVAFESWTASVHQIAAFMIEKNIVNFTNSFSHQVVFGV